MSGQVTTGKSSRAAPPIVVRKASVYGVESNASVYGAGGSVEPERAMPPGLIQGAYLRVLDAVQQAGAIRAQAEGHGNRLLGGSSAKPERDDQEDRDEPAGQSRELHAALDRLEAELGHLQSCVCRFEGL